jgi:hypothetical protein
MAGSRRLRKNEWGLEEKSPDQGQGIGRKKRIKRDVKRDVERDAYIRQSDGIVVLHAAAAMATCPSHCALYYADFEIPFSEDSYDRSLA